MRMRRILKWSGLLAVCCFATAGQAQIKNGLVVHLPFDNNYNNTAPGSSVTATASGAPVFASGKLGSGVTLTTLKDGSVINYVTLGTPPELQFGDQASGTDFSICFWVNYTNQVDDPAFIATQDWNSSNNQGWGIYSQGGGNFRLVTTDDRGSAGKQSTTYSTILRDGKWHHVAAVWTRTNAVDVYVDGSLIASSSLLNVTGSIDAGPVNIGQDGTGAYTDGGSAQIEVTMDDLGIWRRALTSGEVSAIYTAGLGGTNIDNVPTIVVPYVKSTSPAKGDTGVAPLSTVSAIITDGVTAVDTNTVQLLLNGTAVSTTVSKQSANTTVTYTPTSPLASGTTTARLIFASKATPAVWVTNDWSFSVAPYITLTADLKVTPDTSKPGFVFNVFANQADQANTTARTEAALAGQLTDSSGVPLPNLADPAVQGPALAPGSAPNPANATIRFEIPTVINMDVVGGSSSGSFVPDDQMPGFPATDTTSDGAAAEIITYLELPAGITTMAVASDDGFRTSVGKPAQDVLKSLTAGMFEGGRGVVESKFYINVVEAGVYAFRTTWENGNGGANIEWYTYKADGTKVLVNDVAGGGIKAYRAATTAFGPYVKYVSPGLAPRQLNQVSSTITVVLSDGTTAIDDSSVQLKLGGAVVGTAKRAGSLVTVTHTPTGIMFPADPNQLELTFKDTAGTSTTAKGTIMNLKNVVLPAPKIVESFDSYAEGDIPTGWAATNYTDCSGSFCQSPGLDLDNLNSDSYKGWIVVSRDRLQTLKGRIFNGPAPNQTSNGVPVTTMGSGNMLYAESDVRDGNQVQFIYTKAYDLSAVTNAAISFESFYEQNQDSMGAVEYSIDGGKNWLPAVYYLDFADGGGDIRLAPDGTVDAVATFTNPNADTAAWTVNGVAKGGNYGDGIAAPITQALGRFIAPRENDNSVEGKRLEIYRLEKAGKQADVRLRLAQLGTGSWYFGIDNLAFYDVPTAPIITEQPVISLTPGTGGALTISWTGSGTLYESSDLKAWTVSANQGNPQNITVGTGNKFYRVGP